MTETLRRGYPGMKVRVGSMSLTHTTGLALSLTLFLLLPYALAPAQDACTLLAHPFTAGVFGACYSRYHLAPCRDLLPKLGCVCYKYL